MNEIVRVEVGHLDRIPVAGVIGEVDSSNAAAVGGRLIEAVGDEGLGLVVDLAQTGYIDSAGIRMLFDVGERLRVRGMEMRLVAVPASFTADVLETVRIAERFPVDGDVPTAVTRITDQFPRECAAD